MGHWYYCMPDPKKSKPSAADLEHFDRTLSRSKNIDGAPDENTGIDMRIARDGTWFYHGSAIRRKPLVRLFSTVLRREDDGDYYLVTPVERVRIRVDDAPFTAVEMFVEGAGESQMLSFRTNVDDVVTLDDAHPLRVAIDAESGEPSPYVRVRDNLEALIVRPVFYDLVELGFASQALARSQPAGQALARSQSKNENMIGVWSDGTFFEVGRTDEGAAR